MGVHNEPVYQVYLSAHNVVAPLIYLICCQDLWHTYFHCGQFVPSWKISRDIEHVFCILLKNKLPWSDVYSSGCSRCFLIKKWLRWIYIKTVYNPWALCFISIFLLITCIKCTHSWSVFRSYNYSYLML